MAKKAEKTAKRRSEEARLAREGARRMAAAALGVLAAAVLAMTIRTFGFELILVRSSSMNDALRQGDVVLISRSKEPERGNIVLASALNGRCLRRVIGEPGDEVRLTEGEVVVNGLPMYEPYALGVPEWETDRVTLDSQTYLLMPDVRFEDSAMIPASGIRGVAMAVIWPLGRWSFL